MAAGIAAYRPQPESAEDLGPLDVDESFDPGTNVIHIDGRTGQVAYERADGSLTVGGFGGKKSDDGPGTFDDNLASKDGVPLQSIAARLLEGIAADIQSRADWEETANRGKEILGIRLDPANTTTSEEGTISNAHSMALIEAVIRSWANSRGELLPASGPVKVVDDLPGIDQAQNTAPVGNNGGPPMDGSEPQEAPGAGQQDAQTPNMPLRSELADALEKDLNRFLTVTDREYYPDFSRMLLNRAIIGIQFRKVYRCPLRRRPASVWVKGEDLIVSNDTSHLSGAGRVTERIKMRQATVKRMQAAKVWLDITLTQPMQGATITEQSEGEITGVRTIPQLPADQLHTIYECYCELDDGPLANDENGHNPGFPLPYRVTIDKDSQQVLEISRNWKAGDETYTARRRYVKYGFVPGFGFYDWGLVHILGNPQRASTAMQRILIDTGMFNSFPGWLQAKGAGTRQRTNEVRPNPGEAVVIDTGGMPIGDVIMALPYKEPSAVLQSMLGTVAGDMRRVAGIMEMPVGEGRVGNTPVGTIMAYVDAITKVPSAVHKDDHAAQAEEFELLLELFREEPEALTANVRRPAKKGGYTAEELGDQDLVPQADPNVPSQTHRLMQAQALNEAAGAPQYAGIANPRGIWNRLMRTINVEDRGEVTLPEQAAAPPPPDPKVLAAQIKAQSEHEDNQTRLAVAQQNSAASSEKTQIDAEQRAADRNAENQRAGIDALGKASDNRTKLATHASGLAVDHAQHTDKINQADRHKAVDVASDLATAAQPATPSNDTGGQT